MATVLNNNDDNHLDKHPAEDNHDGGQDDSTLLETVGHGQDAYLW